MAKTILNDNRREYGGGLRKFEPNDVNGGLVLGFSVIGETDIKEVLGMSLADDEALDRFFMRFLEG